MIDITDIIVRTGYVGKVEGTVLHEIAGRATYYAAEFVEHIAEVAPDLLHVLGM